jgi:predicted DNA-binding WGR domain protein
VTVKLAEKRKLQKSSKKVKQEPQEIAEGAVNDENEDPEVKKFKKEDNSKNSLKLEAQLKAQSDMFWKLKDTLNSELPTDIVRVLLEENGQKLKVQGREDLLTFLTECMIFGPLQHCTKCHYGQFVFRGDAYYCTGFVTQWTSCQNKTQNPARKTNFIIRKEYKDEYVCLKTFKFKTHQRVFAKTLDDIENKKENLKKIGSVARLPLNVLHFSSCGKLSKTNQQIKLLIKKYGGIFSTELNTLTCAVISNKEELEKMNKKMRECESLGICVVSEGLLNELSENASRISNAEDFILKFKISEWNFDLKQTIENCINASEQKKLQEKSGKSMCEEKSGMVKMKLKGGAVVDPDSGLEDEGHVLLEDETKDPYSSVLGLVDLARDSNSYYKLQIIEHDDKKKYYVFRAWGRIGTHIGGNKLDSFKNRDEAAEEFCRLYLEKTGNEWDERRFATKHPMKFYPLELDYGVNVILYD